MLVNLNHHPKRTGARLQRSEAVEDSEEMVSVDGLMALRDGQVSLNTFGCYAGGVVSPPPPPVPTDD